MFYRPSSLFLGCMCPSQFKFFVSNNSKYCFKPSTLPYLAFRFGGRSLSASDFVLHVKLVDVCVSLWWREVRLQLLSKVELNSTILHQDVRKQGTACQRLLGCPKSHAQPHSVLRKAHLHLVTTVEVLKWQEKQHVSFTF